jgi:hypothetical protein
MNSMRKLAVSMTGAVAIATLVGTSAFAESRHSDATNEHQSREHSSRSNESRDHSSTRSNEHRSGESSRTQADTYRNNDRGRSNDSYRNNNRSFAPSETYRNNRGSASTEAYRNNNRGYAQSESYRNNNRGYSSESYRNGYDRSRGNDHNSRPAYDSRGRRSFSIGGRISRFLHESGGYRIWVDGGRYPIWIPEARIGLFPRLRVGLSLNFGGYYDPLGYVEAYDYYNDGYGYDGGAYSSGGLLRGVVETVDYRRGTLVLRDETSGSFVTALIRDRRLESLRPGDFAEISGDWTRAGVFEALRLENVDGGRY